MQSICTECIQFVNGVLARVPQCGSVVSFISAVRPPVAIANLLQENWFAGLMGGLAGHFYLKYQDERLARKCLEDEDLRITGERDALRDNSHTWKDCLDKENHKKLELIQEIANRAKAEDALRQRVQKLEQDLANEKGKHLADLLDVMDGNAQKQIQIAEDKVNVLDDENKPLKKIVDNKDDIISRLQREIDYLKGLITAKDLESKTERLNVRDLITAKDLKLQELETRANHLEKERDCLQKRLDDQEAENYKNAEKMNEKISQLEEDMEFCLTEKKNLMEKMDKQERVKERVQFHEDLVTELSASVDHLKGEKEKLQGEINEEKKVRKTLEQNRVLLLTLKEKLREELNDVSEINGDLLKENEEMKEEMELAAKENEQKLYKLISVNDLLRKDLEEVSARNYDLLEEIAEKDKNEDALLRRIQELQQDLTDGKMNNEEALTSANENLKRRNEELERKNQGLEGANEVLLVLVERLEKANVENDAFITEQQLLLKDAYVVVETLQADMEDMRSRDKQR